MAGFYLSVPVDRLVDSNGVPMNGARLQFYLTGTTTPASVYTSATMGTPLPNPVVSDSAGLLPPIFLDPTVTYRVQWQTSGGTVIQDIDPVFAPNVPAAGSITAAMLASGAAVGSLGFTPVNRAGDTATNLLLANSAISENSAGWLGVNLPNVQSGNYTLALSDAGKMIFANSGSAITWIIPKNATVPFPRGTTIVFRNFGAGVVTIQRDSTVNLRLAGSGTSKDMSLAQWGLATAILESGYTDWCISGVGVT